MVSEEPDGEAACKPKRGAHGLAAMPRTSKTMDSPNADQAQAATAEQTPDSPARRRFLRFLMSFSVVSSISIIAAPIVGFLIPPKVQSASGGGKVLAGSLTDIPAGTGLVVAMGSKPVIVTNTEAGVTAFSAVCTHLGCIVDFDATVRQIVCPCHDGHFNASTGVVVSGPPPRPLAPVATTIEGDQVFLLPGGA